MGSSKFNVRLNEGTYFSLRCLTLVIALSNIHYVMQDLDRFNDVGLTRNLIIGNFFIHGFYVFLHSLLAVGITWSIDWLVFGWLLVHGLAIPIASVSLGLTHDIPWSLGFSKSHAVFVSEHLSIDDRLVPAVGLVIVFVHFLIVCFTYIGKDVLGLSDNGRVLPMVQMDIKSMSPSEAKSIAELVMKDKSVTRTINKLTKNGNKDKEYVLPVFLNRKQGEGDM